MHGTYSPVPSPTRPKSITDPSSDFAIITMVVSGIVILGLIGLIMYCNCRRGRAVPVRPAARPGAGAAPADAVAAEAVAVAVFNNTHPAGVPRQMGDLSRIPAHIGRGTIPPHEPVAATATVPVAAPAPAASGGAGVQMSDLVPATARDGSGDCSVFYPMHVGLPGQMSSDDSSHSSSASGGH